MEAAWRTLGSQMGRGDLQEPGERINSAKEFLRCLDGLRKELKKGPTKSQLRNTPGSLAEVDKESSFARAVRLPKIKPEVT
jgi:hypothetical protein